MTNFVSDPIFWDEAYNNNRTGWNLKTPTPVFVRIVKEKKIIKPGKLLILGSGYGYDAVEAAKEGFDVTAVDFSVHAIRFTQNLAGEASVKIELLKLDIFNITEKFFSRFDAVYDYVTFCAVNPSRREEYASVVSSVLKPGGKLIALWFPVEEREGGPPFAINVAETEKLFKRYLTLLSTSTDPDTIKPRKGREVLQIFRKDL